MWKRGKRLQKVLRQLFSNQVSSRMKTVILFELILPGPPGQSPRIRKWLFDTCLSCLIYIKREDFGSRIKVLKFSYNLVSEYKVCSGGKPAMKATARIKPTECTVLSRYNFIGRLKRRHQPLILLDRNFGQALSRQAEHYS
jgi:hypothetical protein